MIDVFVKVWCDTPLRLGLAMAVVERLKMFPNTRLHILCAKDTLHFAEWTEDKNFLWCDKEKFWITTKAYAEQAAKSDVYVVIDDDHLPIGKDWLSTGAKALDSHPDYGMLCSWSVNGEVPEMLRYRCSCGQAFYGHQANEGEHELHSISRMYDNDVFESDSIGCPYFIRKDILSNNRRTPAGQLMLANPDAQLPDGRLENYDTILTKHVMSRGWKTGFLRNVRHNHLGMSYSQVIPGHWSAAVA